MIGEVNEVILINICLSLLLCYAKSLSIHPDRQTEIAIRIIILLIIFLFLSNAHSLSIHADVQTKITTSWIILTLFPHHLYASSNLFHTRLTGWIWMISEDHIILIINECSPFLLCDIIRFTIHLN